MDHHLLTSVKSSKTILPSYFLGWTSTFLISNSLKSNFVSFLLELNSDNAYKEGSKQSDPFGRICGEIGNGVCCGE
jgi:hypothetical protein